MLAVDDGEIGILVKHCDSNYLNILAKIAFKKKQIY